jgi:hypothetical protein
MSWPNSDDEARRNTASDQNQTVQLTRQVMLPMIQGFVSAHGKGLAHGLST